MAVEIMRERHIVRDKGAYLDVCHRPIERWRLRVAK